MGAGLGPSTLDVAKTGFIKLINHRLPILLASIHKKEVSGRDIIVLLTCLHFTNWKTGKCKVTTKKLSEVLDTAQPNIRGSLRRLKACNLIVNAEDRDGTPYMIPHPKLFECASGKARGLLLKGYYSAIYGDDYEASVQDEELEYFGSQPSTLQSPDLDPDGDDSEDPRAFEEF